MTTNEIKQSWRLFANSFTRLMTKITNRVNTLDNSMCKTFVTVDSDTVDLSNGQVLHYVYPPEGTEDIVVNNVPSDRVSELLIHTYALDIRLNIGSQVFWVIGDPDVLVKIYPKKDMNGNDDGYVLVTSIVNLP